MSEESTTKRRRRRRTPKQPEVEQEVLEQEEQAEEEEAPAPKTRRRRTTKPKAEEEAKPAPRKRRRKAAPKPEPEPEPEDEYEDGDDWDEDEAEYEDEPEPEPEPAPKRTRRKRTTTKKAPAKRTRRRKQEPEAEEVDDGDDEAEPAPKATTRRKRRETVTEMVEEGDKLEQLSSGDFVETLFELLNKGVAITLRPLGGKVLMYQSTTVDKLASAIPVGRGKTKSGRKRYAIDGKTHWNTICTPEFLEFEEDWKQYSYEEKVEIALDEGVEWVRHDDQRTDNMRLTQAVREAREITKFRPEYQDKQARDDLRELGIYADAIDEDEYEDDD